MVSLRVPCKIGHLRRKISVVYAFNYFIVQRCVLPVGACEDYAVLVPVPDASGENGKGDEKNYCKYQKAGFLELSELEELLEL